MFVVAFAVQWCKTAKGVVIGIGNDLILSVGKSVACGSAVRSPCSRTSVSVFAADEKGRVQRLPPEQRSGSELNVLAGTAVYAAPPAQPPVRIETSHRFGLFAFC